MSARDELTAIAVRHGVPGLLLAAALDAYRAELRAEFEATLEDYKAAILREAAEKIRDGICVFDTAMATAVAHQGPLAVIAYAQLVIADAIDPDKT